MSMTEGQFYNLFIELRRYADYVCTGVKKVAGLQSLMVWFHGSTMEQSQQVDHTLGSNH